MSETVQLREVGPRDGLQMTATILSTEQKLEWCRREVAAGLVDIEVTSFVSPKLAPQFADAADVARRAILIEGCRPAALVPNLKGAQLALEAGLTSLYFVMSASEAHNRANVRRTTEESLDEFRRIIEHRDTMPGKKAWIGSGIATAFGCTIQGEVPERRVVEIAARLAEAGADGINVADTVGYGDPAQVRRLVKAVMDEVAPLPVACHFHDTRGLGLANILAAVDVGVRSFDASLAGIGGCPFAPSASGNVDTEGTAFLLERLGLDTGIDLEALMALRQEVERWLPGEQFARGVGVAGLPRR
ncbi:hydroxymethylglutaryl-CoA lyase [Sphingomonas histidinilytica]|uniref:Hydroxymethylglutaryl-CoA lyase n=1 Tax=Rhizorhabdus histidinilytica TaxID=439228 RepID=A0A1T5FNT8_9SPHN|nr:hydroxymethylglutaryl-CoA lyase [Rhizorhabdus histidinilytica]MBO9377123.1 hydroxymethylglutaryl-CoA lyase [Rhizorhabdus histidinilytica]SKB97828.1 hydroxymethylglutaryl-CoA lyase [Rhizorhabdus histidinilytica]